MCGALCEPCQKSARPEQLVAVETGHCEFQGLQFDRARRGTGFLRNDLRDSGQRNLSGLFDGATLTAPAAWQNDKEPLGK
jgi:hypothetical protein